MIVATHLSAYISVLEIPAGHFMGESGRSLFVFISGYSLTLAYSCIKTWKEVKNFSVKRLMRIYPLYILALTIFVVLFHYCGVWHQMDIKPVLPTVLAHLAACQMLFSPLIAPMLTLWFIGCIIPYYLVYAVLVKYGYNVKRMITLAVMIFVLFGGFKIFTGVCDYMLLYYYPIFVGGVLAGKVKILAGHEGDWKCMVVGALAVR